MRSAKRTYATRNLPRAGAEALYNLPVGGSHSVVRIIQRGEGVSRTTNTLRNTLHGNIRYLKEQTDLEPREYDVETMFIDKDERIYVYAVATRKR